MTLNNTRIYAKICSIYSLSGNFEVNFNYIKNLLTRIFANPSIYYRLAALDLENQTVTLHIIQKNIFIKHTFAEVVSSPEIIDKLAPQQACWIGVYYGKALRNALTGKDELKNIKKPSYLLKHEQGQYKITSENRDGSIGYIHVKSRKEFTLHPVSIAENENIIKNFDASQACYIGILAGIAMEKNQHLKITETKKWSVPYLKIVK